MRRGASALVVQSLFVLLAAGQARADKPPPSCEPSPEAKINPDQRVVDEGTAGVDFNFTASRGDTFTWAQTQGPTVAFDVSDKKLSFTAPDVPAGGATLKFSLIVTGCPGTSPSSAEATVTVRDIVSANRPPVAVAAASSTTVNEGGSFTLDGSGSYDPDGDALTYTWERQVVGGGYAPVSNAAVVVLTAPDVSPAGTSLRFRLTVWDGHLSAAAQQDVTVTWVNAKPTAVISCSSSPVKEGEPIVLDASGSTDPDDGIDGFSWTQKEGGPAIGLGPTALTSPAFSFDAPAIRQGLGDTMTFEVKVTDRGGLWDTARCSVKIEDATGPELSISGNEAEATSPAGAVVNFVVTATDAWDGVEPAENVTCDRPSPATFPVGDTLVHCSGVDAAGNESLATFTVTVTDTTPPTLTVPDPITTEATGPSGAKVDFIATANDLVDGSRPTTCAPASGDTFPLGTTEVSCSAADTRGNAATKQFSVTVVDTTPPDVTVPADITKVEATGPNGAVVSFTASASDLVDGSRPTTCTPASGATFPLGTTEVSCSAADTRGNAATKKFNVTVVDTTPPDVTVPTDFTVEATGPNGAQVDFTATADDRVDGAVATSCTPASPDLFPLGNNLVVCEATDAHGNKGTAHFNVTVQDTTKPVLDLPSDLYVLATSARGAVVTFTATATDIVDVLVTAHCTPSSGSVFAPGETIVTCSAMDFSGNEAEGTFTVEVGFTFLGFFQPVDNWTATSKVVNVVKGGSTVPVKFKIQGDRGIEITETAAVDLTKTGAVEVTCGTVDALPQSEIELTATGGTSLRYDVTGRQFIFNWQTPKAPGHCYRFDVVLKDGKGQTAVFKLK